MGYQLERVSTLGHCKLMQKLSYLDKLPQWHKQ